MKRIRKMIALAITMVMVLGMSMSAFAAETKGSITVTEQKYPAGAENTTYEVYKIFDLVPTTDADGNPIMDGEEFSGVRYTIDSDWADFFAAGADGAGYIVAEDTTNSLPQIVVDGVTKYINITEDNVQAFAKAAFIWSQEQGLDADATNTTGEFTDLDLGYYMVYPKGANLNIGDFTSIVSLTSTNPNQEIQQKAEYPTATKTDDDASVEVGQTVTYTVTSKVPDMSGFESFDYWVNDEMTEGLTFDGEDSVSVTVGGEEYTDFAVEGTGNKFTVKIDLFKNKDDLTVGDEVVVTYTATVNSNAITKVEKNKATLEYSNNPQNGEDHTTTPPSETEVWSAKIVITKVDGSDSSIVLPGAKFVLKCTSVTETTDAEAGTKPTAIVDGFYAYDEENDKVSWVEDVTDADLASEAAATAKGLYIVETDENGEAVFGGLEAGTYVLYEIVAPDGYNKLDGPSDPITVNEGSKDATAAELTATAKVENNAGSVLPSTGGIGTTIFYVIGAVLVIGAGVLLVTRRRMSAN